MRLTTAYSKIKKRNLVLINNDTYQRETLSERRIRQPLNQGDLNQSPYSVDNSSSKPIQYKEFKRGNRVSF